MSPLKLRIGDCGLRIVKTTICFSICNPKSAISSSVARHRCMRASRENAGPALESCFGDFQSKNPASPWSAAACCRLDVLLESVVNQGASKLAHPKGLLMLIFRRSGAASHRRMSNFHGNFIVRGLPRRLGFLESVSHKKVNRKQTKRNPDAHVKMALDLSQHPIPLFPKEVTD